MIRILMNKYGNLLNNRPSAKEAFLRMNQIINTEDKDTIIVLDFAGVEVLSPSYADEILTQLKKKYGKKRVEVENANAQVVKKTIEEVLSLQDKNK